MGIFNGKTVFGLFGRDDEVEKTVVKLQKRGFGKKDNQQIHIIDEHRLTQEMPINEAGQSVMPPASRSATGPATVYNPVQTTGAELATIENSALTALKEKGLDHKAATFHARHIARGSSMVIVETPKEQVGEVEQIMKEANARVSVA